jgi:hypothetical protein
MTLSSFSNSFAHILSMVENKTWLNLVQFMWVRHVVLQTRFIFRKLNVKYVNYFTLQSRYICRTTAFLRDFMILPFFQS